MHCNLEMVRRQLLGKEGKQQTSKATENTVRNDFSNALMLHGVCYGGWGRGCSSWSAFVFRHRLCSILLCFHLFGLILASCNLAVGRNGPTTPGWVHFFQSSQEPGHLATVALRTIREKPSVAASLCVDFSPPKKLGSWLTTLKHLGQEAML